MRGAKLRAGWVGRDLPGWWTHSSVKPRTIPMTITRSTLAAPAMAHLLEHFAMATSLGAWLPPPLGPESRKLCSSDWVGDRSSQQHLFSLGPGAPLGGGGVWSSSSLPTLLSFPLPPRILTGQAENPVTLTVNFEHVKRQQRMLAGAPTHGLSARPGSWGSRDLGTYNKHLPYSSLGSPVTKRRPADGPFLFLPCPRESRRSGQGW